MIALYEQILSFIINFLFGIIMGIVFIIIKKYIYNCKNVYKFFNSFLFSIFTTFVYFKLNYRVNNGYINMYFILIFIGAYTFSCKILQKKCQNKSNRL